MAEKTFQFEVGANRNEYDVKIIDEESWHFQPFCVINNPYGFWINNSYLTVKGYTDSEIKRNNLLQSLTSKKMKLNQEKPTLWVMGDSIQNYFYQYLKRESLLCLQYTCENTYGWMYPFPGNNYYAKENFIVDGNDFNHTEFLNNIKNIILSKPMRNRNSVFLINFGLHLMKNLNMSEAEVLFDEFVMMVHTMKENTLVDEFPKIIWKTTTPTYIISNLSKRHVVKQVCKIFFSFKNSVNLK